MILEELEVKEKLKEYISILKSQKKEHDIEVEPAFLISGLLGNSMTKILCAYYADKESELEEGIGLFKEVYDVYINYKNDSNLAYGYAGLGLCLLDLMELELVSNLDEMSPTFKNLDIVISESLEMDLKTGNFDLFAGMIGKGVYLLKRYEYTNEVLPTLERIIDNIYALRKEAEIGSYWEAKSIKDGMEEKIISNGLSHGLPSIIAFVSECLLKGVAMEKSQVIIEEAVAWILSQEDVRAASANKFPMSISLDKINEPPSFQNRLAWCYGDLGLTLSLLKASIATDDIELRLKSLQMIERLMKVEVADAGFTTKEDCIDLGFCHGAVGVALIFFRFHQLLGDDRILNRANYWMEFVFSEIDRARGNLVFPAFNPDTNTFELEYCNNIIQGIDGLILSMMTFAHPELSWDTIFLTNVETFR